MDGVTITYPGLCLPYGLDGVTITYPISIILLFLNFFFREQPWVRGFQLPRKTCWITECECVYRYGGTGYSPNAAEFIWEILDQIKRRSTTLQRCDFDCCNANLYYDDECACGWHGDTEKLFDAK